MAHHFTVRSPDELELHIEKIHASAAHTCRVIQEHPGSPMELFRMMKFDPVGLHPIAGHPLNVIEQINQTATYLVALEAARLLFSLHPEEPGYIIAPGAHMSHDLDIMSLSERNIGAETFSAVHPRNNDKLRKDLTKLASREERHRYVFFSSPLYPVTKRRTELEAHGVQVWSLASKR